MLKIKWTRPVGWLLLGVLLALFVTVLFLLIDSALDKGIDSPSGIFLIVLGVAATAATLFASRDVLKVRHPRSLARPAPVAALFLLLFAFVSTMTDALSLLEPRPAVESAPGAIETGVNLMQGDLAEIRKRVAPAASAVPRVVKHVAGLWGEPGCESAYRFALQDKALTVDWERRPNGVAPYRLVATVINAQADVLEVRGETPAEARGKAATFTYQSSGPVERLTWDDQVSPVPLELDRCG